MNCSSYLRNPTCRKAASDNSYSTLQVPILSIKYCEPMWYSDAKVCMAADVQRRERLLSLMIMWHWTWSQHGTPSLSQLAHWSQRRVHKHLSEWLDQTVLMTSKQTSVFKNSSGFAWWFKPFQEFTFASLCVIQAHHCFLLTSCMCDGQSNKFHCKDRRENSALCVKIWY